MNNTVYIVNESGHDYSDALRFGDLAYITRGTLDKYNVNQMYRAAVEALEDSRPNDYILLTSLSTLCSVVCAVFSRKHGRLNLLLYKDGGYIERNLQIDQLLQPSDHTSA